MVPWWFFVLLLTNVLSEPATKESEKPAEDSDAAGTDFFPHYNGFPSFPIHTPAVLPPQDLTPLQQTHVLGDFSQRFQQHRFSPPQLPNNPNQQLLFNQQTEFGGPQQQNSFSNQQIPQHVLPPPADQPRPVQFAPQQTFRQPLPPATISKPATFPTDTQFQDQRPTFLDSRNPQLPEHTSRPLQPSFQGLRNNPSNSPFQNQQTQAIFQDPSFRTQQTFGQQQLRNSQQSNSQSSGSNQFQEQNIRNSQPPSNPQFLNERHPQNQGFVDNRNNQFFEQPRQPSQEKNQQFSDQRNPNFPSPSFSQALPDPNQQQYFNQNQRNPTVNIQNFQNKPHLLQSQPQSPSSQPQTPQHLTNQFQAQSQNNPPRFSFPQRPETEQSNFQNIPPPNFQSSLPLNPVNSQNFQHSFPPADKPNQPPVSLNPNRKPAFLPTQFPSISDDTTQYNLNIVHSRGSQQQHRRPLLPLLPTALPPIETTSKSPDTSGFLLQKSQEQNYYSEGVSIENQPSENEIYSAPVTASPSSPAPVKVRKPKPEVKEITINLATTPAPVTTLKNDRSKSARKEKSQEEIINEQIQKLLQGHNLEILGKGPGQDPQLPELPEGLKDKVKIQLVNEDFLTELNGGQKKKEKSISNVSSQPVLPPLPDLPDHIKKQYDIKLVQKDELFKQFKIGEGGKLIANSDLVAPLPGGTAPGNASTVYLANGQQLQIVNFAQGDKKTISPTSTAVEPTTTTTSKPPQVLFQELSKGIIPPGADFELIKTGPDGQVEKVKDLTSAKKVTFVILEEQPDGSVKVQGVKGNVNTDKTDKESVDSWIKKINDGSIKLPPSNSIQTNEIPRQSSTISSHKTSFVTIAPFTERNFDSYTTQYYTTSPAATHRPVYNPFVTESPVVTTTESDYAESTFVPTAATFTTTTTRRPKSKSRPSFLPTPTYNHIDSSTPVPKRYKGSKRPSRRKVSTTSSTTELYAEYDDEEEFNHRSSSYNGEGSSHNDVVAQASNHQPSRPLNLILQENGLHEMAKFLSQSGLDSILNETGPYTIFIPTDAAFANLQDQLGGSDKAEDKFRENPRLLSGLLLHHVVPGSFRISDLQDEMTGVSLAGTQLRVNTYNSENKETFVTINGALVSETQKDITVPQGLAHAVDRVLFPLPVGDLLQTLKGDRERRFTKFVKSIEASGLTDMFTGTKTYTLFAPSDKAFAALTDAELDKLLTKREAARTIVLRHVMPGTLYSAGMHYLQIKESMERGQKITIQKELGKIKANSAHLVSTNIPATNGVVHVLENLL